jgi:hypothetical protein
MVMQLYIAEESRIKNIQTEFNIFYPFLKIDFLKEQGANKIRKLEKLNPNELVKFVGKLDGATQLDVDRQRTVSEIKKDLKETFGLTAEVYRKSGNVWIETSLTDNWTLEQQNHEGELISVHTRSG